MYYINVSKEQIEGLRPAIDLLVQLWGEDLDKGSLYIYGLIDERSPLIATLQAAVSGGKVTYGVVAIPVNSDSLYFITGSGYTLKAEEFAYVDGGEIRTAKLSATRDDAVATLASFSKMAVSSSNTWMDRFIKLEAPVEAHNSESTAVQRSESGSNLDHGGLVHEAPEIGEKQSSVGSVVDTWATTNIEDWSVSELYELLHKLLNEGVATEEAKFFMWTATNSEGYLIQVDGDPSAAARLIATQLGVSEEDVMSEGATLSGRELAEAIEALLGGN